MSLLKFTIFLGLSLTIFMDADHKSSPKRPITVSPVFFYDFLQYLRNYIVPLALL